VAHRLTPLSEVSIRQKSKKKRRKVCKKKKRGGEKAETWRIIFLRPIAVTAKKRGEGRKDLKKGGRGATGK